MASYFWSDALIYAINNVGKRLLTTELAVVIKDKYPKAMYHFLVLPWKDVDSVYDLTSDDEGLLGDMYELALEAADSTGLPAERFEFGYHMKPSMRRLHLHVISKDYHSPCLTHPYHWTAFNTDFFMKHESVVERIRAEGRIQRPSGKRILELLDSPLQCNQCTYQTTIFQDLKQHLEQHVDVRNSKITVDAALCIEYSMLHDVEPQYTVAACNLWPPFTLVLPGKKSEELSVPQPPGNMEKEWSDICSGIAEHIEAQPINILY